ncbi:MAG: type II secretion system protein GspN [Myxococcales bacterium]|nr:type II secretion system protein GspN [Myxococcales bacterium]
MLSPTVKKILYITALVVLFIAFFFMFLALTFPAERFIPSVEQTLSETLGREVRIGDMSLTPLGKLRLEMVRISGPTKNAKTQGSATAAPTSAAKDDASKNGDAAPNDDEAASAGPAPGYHIDEALVSVGFGALLRNRIDVSAKMRLAGGDVRFRYVDDVSTRRRNKSADTGKQSADSPAEAKKGPLHFSLQMTEVSLGSLVDFRSLLPMPIYGQLDFDFQLDSATGLFQDANGRMDVRITEGSLGRGKVKVAVMEGMDPMTVDAVVFDALDLHVEIDAGTAMFETRRFKSPDLDFSLEGNFDFMDPFRLSMANLYFKFRMLDAYKSKSASAQTLVSLMDTVPSISRGKRNDGFFGFAYRGRVGQARFRPSKMFIAPRRVSPERTDDASPRPERRVFPSRDNAGAQDDKPASASRGPAPMGPNVRQRANVSADDDAPTGPFRRMNQPRPAPAPVDEPPGAQGHNRNMAEVAQEAETPPPDAAAEVPTEVPAETAEEGSAEAM